jgi:hypothetical protein
MRKYREVFSFFLVFVFGRNAASGLEELWLVLFAELVAISHVSLGMLFAGAIAFLLFLWECSLLVLWITRFMRGFKCQPFHGFFRALAAAAARLPLSHCP